MLAAASTPFFHGFFEYSAATSVELAVRYTLFAGLAWLLGYVCFRRRWFHRKIVQKFPTGSDVRRELAWSALTVVIFAVVGALTIAAIRQGWTRLYWKDPSHSRTWFWASVVICIFVHDTYFYWTHRAMHHPRLFRWFHRVHHLSHNPSPWASYAFSPAEAVVQAGIFPLIVFTIPIHPYAFALFMVWQITFNVIGHTGYEYNPRRFMSSWVRFFLNTPTNHAMHHEKMRGNYGLYFNFWDRLMRTNHADYEARFCEVTTRARELPAGNHPTSARP